MAVEATAVPEVVAPVVDEAVKADAVKVFTWEELKALDSKSNLHLLIHGKVYGIAKFLDEHPGGDEVMFGEVGRDGTEAFEDVGHSDEARKILDQYYVGVGPDGVPVEKVKKVRAVGAAESGSSSMMYLLPLAVLGAYLAYRFYGGSAVEATV